MLEMFERVVCINLDERPDRWEAAVRAYEGLGGGRALERFPASRVEPCASRIVNGRAGCLLSHRRVLEAAQRDGLASVLVLEDDVEFTDDAPAVLAAALPVLSALPWDMAFLGLEPRAPLFPVAPAIARVLHGATTHAVAYHSRIYARLLAQLPREDEVVAWLARHVAVDQFYCDVFLPRVGGYAVTPFVARQRGGRSDVEGCDLPPKAPTARLSPSPRIHWTLRRTAWEAQRPVRWLLRRARARRFRRRLARAERVERRIDPSGHS